MHCPFCGHEETKVIDSRLAGEGRQIRRRRECLACAERFTTFETAELLMPLVVKADRSREPFDEQKMRHGIVKALEKRPVSQEAIEAAVTHVCNKLRSLGEREVPSRSIGAAFIEWAARTAAMGSGQSSSPVVSRWISCRCKPA